METKNIDLGQVGVVNTVADTDHMMVEVGGSIQRFPLSGFINSVAGDSAGALSALIELKEAFESGDTEFTAAVLTAIEQNREDVTALKGKEEQFGHQGYINWKNGVVALLDTYYRYSGLIPLNRNFPIVFKVTVDGLAGLCFFDADGAFISGVDIATALGSGTEQTIATSDFPKGACFFAISTAKGTIPHSYWINGPTREARENVVAELISSSLSGLTGLKQMFTLCGFIDANGRRVNGGGNNTVDDITDWADKSMCTEFIPLNRNYDVKAHHRPLAAHSAIAFYDADLNFISGVTVAAAVHEWRTYKKESFPANAVYFRLSSYLGDIETYPYFIHSKSLESVQGGIVDAIKAAKELALRDRWVTYDCASYDATKEKPYILDELELSYDEALLVDRFACPATSLQSHGGALRVRAMVFSDKNKGGYEPVNMSARAPFSSIEVAVLAPENEKFYANNLNYAFSGCNKLRKVIGLITPLKTVMKTVQAFSQCTALESIKIFGLNASIDFSNSPLLSLASLQYLVSNAANTDVITVTVHADVYAKLTDTANAEWHKVLTDGAAKKISFATV